MQGLGRLKTLSHQAVSLTATMNSKSQLMLELEGFRLETIWITRLMQTENLSLNLSRQVDSLSLMEEQLGTYLACQRVSNVMVLVWWTTFAPRLDFSTKFCTSKLVPLAITRITDLFQWH